MHLDMNVHHMHLDMNAHHMHLDMNVGVSMDSYNGYVKDFMQSMPYNCAYFACHQRSNHLISVTIKDTS